MIRIEGWLIELTNLHLCIVQGEFTTCKDSPFIVHEIGALIRNGTNSELMSYCVQHQCRYCTLAWIGDTLLLHACLPGLQNLKHLICNFMYQFFFFSLPVLNDK